MLILSSDHVYQMDYRHLLQFHQARRADVTVATFPVPRHQSSQFGIVTADPLGEVTSILEKPRPESFLSTGAPAVLASGDLPVPLRGPAGAAGARRPAALHSRPWPRDLPGVWIGVDAEVQESILCDGVHIGRDAQVHRTILDQGTVVLPGARIGCDLAADGEEFTVSDGGITVVGYATRARALASL